MDSNDEILTILVKIYDDLLKSTNKFNTFSAERLTRKPTRWTISLYLFSVLSMIFMVVLISSMVVYRVYGIYILLLVADIAILIKTYHLIHKERISRFERYRRKYNNALVFEPQGLWGMVHPQSGERGRLVKAILGARHLGRVIADTTTVPLSKDVIDIMVTHLVQGISASDELDIHEYYTDETLKFSHLVYHYYNEYYPVIEIQQLLRYGEGKGLG